MERLNIVKEGNIMRKKFCEFRARNSIKNELVFIEVEYYKSSWWYINFKNETSKKAKHFYLVSVCSQNILLYHTNIDFNFLLKT